MFVVEGVGGNWWWVRWNGKGIRWRVVVFCGGMECLAGYVMGCVVTCVVMVCGGIAGQLAM